MSERRRTVPPTRASSRASSSGRSELIAREKTEKQSAKRRTALDNRFHRTLRESRLRRFPRRTPTANSFARHRASVRGTLVQWLASVETPAIPGSRPAADAEAGSRLPTAHVWRTAGSSPLRVARPAASPSAPNIDQIRYIRNWRVAGVQLGHCTGRPPPRTHAECYSLRRAVAAVSGKPLGVMENYRWMTTTESYEAQEKIVPVAESLAAQLCRCSRRGPLRSCP